jgi:tungstate transport system ATP-binding protein
MSSKGPLYQLKDLLFRYGERFELNVPHFSVESGAALGLIGPNGGGKTTLLRILAFIDRPHGGTIFFDGKRANIDDSNLTRSVSMLLQEPYLLKRSVFENVAYGLKVRGERRDMQRKVMGALAMVGLDPGEFTRRSWHELSGGEAQRVALAARLILEPKVLILDEPTSSVDEKSANLIKAAIIESRKKDGTTLIMASHDLIWLNGITTNIFRVAGGRITGPASGNLIPGPWIPYKDGLHQTVLSDGQLVFAPGPPARESQGMIDPSDIVLSLLKPGMMSAQNMLQVIISSLELEDGSGIVRVTMNAGGLRLVSRVTTHAAREMHLLPGEEVWAVFKAAAIRWE